MGVVVSCQILRNKVKVGMVNGPSTPFFLSHNVLPPPWVFRVSRKRVSHLWRDTLPNAGWDFFLTKVFSLV